MGIGVEEMLAARHDADMALPEHEVATAERGWIDRIAKRGGLHIGVARAEMAGGLGGTFKMGRHLQYKLDTPMANLLLTIMDAGGVRLEKFGDSNGRILEPLSLS